MLTIQNDYTWKVISELGKFNQLHFINLNAERQPYELSFTPNLKRIEDSERKLM